jgi:hypothetical protein|tara:strand:+ start:1875 stop:2183 length:309 start_codon:yes stop_codon:yes gene_type:complete
VSKQLRLDFEAAERKHQAADTNSSENPDLKIGNKRAWYKNRAFRAAGSFRWQKGQQILLRTLRAGGTVEDATIEIREMLRKYYADEEKKRARKRRNTSTIEE